MALMRLQTADGDGLTQAVIDPTYGAQRTSLRPLDHLRSSRILGHYRASLVTGTAVNIGAAGILAYLRWTDTANLFVLNRVTVDITVPSAITAATVVDVGLYIARGSSASGSGGNAVTLTGSNQKMRASNMGSSLITDARVATTAALTGPTSRTADANPIGSATWQMLFAPTLGATANTAVAVGAGVSQLKEIYNSYGSNMHPVVLASGEDIEIQAITAGPTTGGIKYYMNFEWSEVAAF